MAEEIINRVANSSLTTIDLEEFYPEGKRVILDIKDWLFHEIILSPTTSNSVSVIFFFLILKVFFILLAMLLRKFLFVST